MKQKFELMASSKANYYTKGSPIQFVKLDLLKNCYGGEVAVCFSFKNVGREPLQNLNIRFKCKDSAGEVVCDSTFCYEGTLAKSGEVFGGDDAVYLSEAPLSSIDVRLLSAETIEGEDISLEEYHRVKLPPQKELPEQVRTVLQQNTNNPDLKYEPAVLDEGWQCACGAFHPGVDEGVYCDECGADRILVQNMITGIRREKLGQSPRPFVDEQPTRMMAGKTMTYGNPDADNDATQVVDAVREQVFDSEDDFEETDEKENVRQFEDDDGNAIEYDEDDEPEYDEIAEREERARMLIRWVPIVTGLMCVLVVAGGMMWYQMFVK